MYAYNSPIGLWKIVKELDGFHLMFDSTCYGVYPSAIAAADDVYCFATGNGDWDSLAGSFEPPQDPSEWEVL